jgi:hypothetical protein
MDASYFPPFALLMSGVVSREDGRVVSLSKELFDRLVAAAASQHFDPFWYRSEYQDVANGIISGEVTDELDHFLSSGYFEGRNPAYFEVDEEWYLTEYPDIAEAVASGVYLDAEAHFNEGGYQEGRVSNDAMREKAATWRALIETSAETLASVNPEVGAVGSNDA